MPASVCLRWLLCGLWALCIFPDARALDPDRMPSQYVREQWNVETGFSGGAVHAIAQTHDGYLWIGADQGLLRFDGFNFRTVSSSGPVLGLTIDSDDNLLVRLPDGVLLRRANGQFENLDSGFGVTASYVTAMSREPGGGVLLSDLLAGILHFRERKLEVLVPRSAFKDVVISMAATPSGKTWIGTMGPGLLYLSQGKVSSVRAAQVPDRNINSLLVDGDNQLWIGTDRGLLHWNGTELTPFELPSPLHHPPILALLRDGDSNIWAATGQGLLRINANGMSFSTDDEVRGGGAVNTLFEDREGNLWVGGAGGLERIRDSAFVTYSRKASQSNGPIFADAGNRIWFAPAERGLCVFKNGRVERVRVAGLEKDVVYSITGRKGEVWLGRQHGGLTRLRNESGVMTSQTYTKGNGLAQNSVYAVDLGRDGTVWAGTLSGGVSRFKDGRFTTYTAGSQLPSNTVNSILETRDGTTWFATPNGLGSLSAGSWRTYTSRDGLPSDSVNLLFEDSSGVLWIATDKGIAFRSSGRIQIPREAPSSLREPIFGMEQDAKGSLWIATAHHVLKVNPESLMGLANEMNWREYGRSDGLESAEGVKRQKSVVVDPVGRIWFSLGRGLSVIDPSHVGGDSAAAIAHVESILADRSLIDLKEPVRVPDSHRRITFAFTGLSLAAPEQVRFRYRLDGFDRSWSEPTASREAVYTNLGPGAYRFRVIANNREGTWNGSETAVSFAVDPAFWETLRFRLSIMMLAGLLALVVLRFRDLRQARQMNRLFEERLAERTRIAQELHDTLLQGFLSASMQLHVANDRLPESSTAKPIVSRVLKLMQEVFEEGRGAVRGLRSASDASSDLDQALSRIPEELKLEQHVEFRVVVKGQTRPLRPLIRNDVYRIGREALINAFRHSQATSIEVELEYGSKELGIVVRDNGCGIDPQILPKGRDGHFGLAGMRERAQRIGAQLKVRSRAGNGTEVELWIPHRVAFESQSASPTSMWLSKLSGRRGQAGVTNGDKRER